MYADGADNARENEINKSRAGYAQTGVGQHRVRVCALGSERLYRGVTAEEREGRTEERGNLELCDEVEEQGAETSHEKGC